MSHLAKLLSIAAFAIAGSAFSNSAHASFTVRLDNSSNPLGVTWADTPNNIAVCYTTVVNGFCWPVGAARPIPGISGNNDFVLSDPFVTVANVAQLWVYTDGDQAFWLDQIELFNASGTKVWSSGVDNTGGWCISTDPTDGNNDNCSLAATTAQDFLVDL